VALVAEEAAVCLKAIANQTNDFFRFSSGKKYLEAPNLRMAADIGFPSKNWKLSFSPHVFFVFRSHFNT
jgi:hypothetical protein